MNTSSLPRFSTEKVVNRTAYSAFGVIQFLSSSPALADDFPACFLLTSTHSHLLFGSGWLGRPQANSAKVNSLYLGSEQLEGKVTLGVTWL